MGFNDMMNKVRQWDNHTSQWITRHFYLLFFEAILAAIFVAMIVNALKLIDASVDMHNPSVLEKLLMAQSVNTLLVVILLLFNSFWMLYIFSSMLKMRSTLRNIDFNLSRRPERRDDARKQHD